MNTTLFLVYCKLLDLIGIGQLSLSLDKKHDVWQYLWIGRIDGELFSWSTTGCNMDLLSGDEEFIADLLHQNWKCKTDKAVIEFRR